MSKENHNHGDHRAGFVVFLFVWYSERKELAKMFPDGLCTVCREPVHFKGDSYIHTATGQIKAETIWDVGGDGGDYYRENCGIAYHRATTPSTPEEQAMYQS